MPSAPGRRHSGSGDQERLENPASARLTGRQHQIMAGLHPHSEGTLKVDGEEVTA